MEEMRNRVGRITNDLNSLLNEITAGRQGSGELEHVLTPEVIKGFKTSVDAMRRLLWLYVETAVQRSSQSMDEQSLQGARDALRSLGARVPLTRGSWVVYRKGRSNCRKENTCHAWSGRAGLLTHRRTASGLGFRDDDLAGALTLLAAGAIPGSSQTKTLRTLLGLYHAQFGCPFLDESRGV